MARREGAPASIVPLEELMKPIGSSIFFKKATRPEVDLSQVDPEQLQGFWAGVHMAAQHERRLTLRRPSPLEQLAADRLQHFDNNNPSNKTN